MDWSWTTWCVSIAAVVVSGLVAWFEGSFTRRPGIEMGFANHGGMWGDLLLLPIVNAVIVPHLAVGAWLPAAMAVAAVASIWVHVHWYRGNSPSHSPEHMWPSRRYGAWWRDLSRAGWAHVVYVIGELTLLFGFLVSPAPVEVVAIVTLVLTLHVPLGLLQPRWFLTRRIATLWQQPLLAPCLVAVWAIALAKI